MGCGGSKEKGSPAEEIKRLTVDRIVEGLKEGLTYAAQWAVEELSAEGGFFNNDKLRIKAPGKMDKIFEKLRDAPLIGSAMGEKIDEFLKKLNSAAETAAKEALPIFADAVANMSFADAGAILQGSNTAASDYLRKVTYDDLLKAFTPIAKQKCEEVGVIKLHNTILEAYNKLPFVDKEKEAIGIEGHVTEKGLDGLFEKLAEYEAQIRGSPNRRTSDLLKEVFDEEAIRLLKEDEEKKANEGKEGEKNQA